MRRFVPACALCLLVGCGHESSPRVATADPAASARASGAAGVGASVAESAPSGSDARGIGAPETPSAPSSSVASSAPPAPPATVGSLGLDTSSGRVGTPEPRVTIPSFADGCVRGEIGCGDPMSQTAVLRTLSSGKAAMRACYDAALAKTPTLAGPLTLVFVVRPNGSVESAEEEGVFPDPTMARCVLAVVKKLVFREPAATNVRIRYPVKFER